MDLLDMTEDSSLRNSLLMNLLSVSGTADSQAGQAR